MSLPMQKSLRLVLLVVLAMFAASCSSSGGEAASSSTSEAPVSVDEETTTTAAAADTTTTEVAEPAVAEVATEFESGRCEFDAPLVDDITIECGWITVPQQWDDPADPDTIRLHVATFTSAATPAEATPVVYLEGGPGGNALEIVNLTFDRFAPILNQHPLVMFTQRGSALSEVDLECEEVVDLNVQMVEAQPDVEAEFAAQIDALETCAARLIEEGADLGAYHSVASAHDVDAIRDALGYDTWNVLGISYGTRLGQELVRTHPDGVEALILDSVQPTDPRLGSLAAVPGTFEGSLAQLFVGCEANAECAAANPDLDQRLRALVAQADADPFELVALDQLTGESYDAIVDGDRLLGSIFQAMYQPETFAAMPEMIGQLEDGNTSTLATLVGLQVTNAPFISNGMYTAVMCHDFLDELTPDSAWEEGQTGDAFFDDTFAGSLQLDNELLCDAFPAGSADASIIEPVVSEVPTLILSGVYDPITPPSFGDAIAPGFSNGQVVVLPHVGHGVVGDDCGMAIALDFLADPDSEADQSCIATSSEPIWVPTSLEGIGFEPFEEPMLGITGVLPEGWDDQGLGISVRSDSNLAHQTVVIQQAGPIPADQFIGLVAAQLGGEPIAAGTIDVGARTWDVYNLDGDAASTRAYLFEDGAFTFLVALIAQEDDLDEVASHIITPILENLQQS